MAANSSEQEPPSHAEAILEGLGRIKVPKSSDVLAERLKTEILGDAFHPGASLPTERELVSSTGLSRGSVREALRILEAQGLVNTRPGRYGGTTVTQPTDSHLAGHINLFAKGRSVPLMALIEVRLALEPWVAFLAAQRRTEEDLVTLRGIAERLEGSAEGEIETFLIENVRWHDALAAASHNDLLRALASPVGVLMFEASHIENFATAEVRHRVIRAHRRILDAIETGDAAAARRRVERDVQAYAVALETVLAAAADKQAPKG